MCKCRLTLRTASEQVCNVAPGRSSLQTRFLPRDGVATEFCCQHLLPLMLQHGATCGQPLLQRVALRSQLVNHICHLHRRDVSAKNTVTELVMAAFRSHHRQKTGATGKGATPVLCRQAQRE